MPVTTTAVIGLATWVANTISGIKDTNKRREVETALQRLSYEDKKNLDDKMIRAKNQNDRLNILIAELNKYNIEKIREAGKKDTRNAVIIIGGSLIFLIAIVFLIKRK